MEKHKHSKLEEMDWTPVSKQVNKDDLKALLQNPKINSLFCYHKWIYWTFGIATKKHRVCSKCYKKQQDMQIIPKYKSKWINSNNYNIL